MSTTRGVQRRQFTTHGIRSSTNKSCVSAHDITKSSHFSWRTPHPKHFSAEQSIKAYLMFSMAWIKYSGERLIVEIYKGDMKISCIPCVQQGRPKKTIWSLVRRKPAKDVTTIRPPICDLTLSSGLDFKAIREKYIFSSLFQKLVRFLSGQHFSVLPKKWFKKVECIVTSSIAINILKEN